MSYVSITVSIKHPRLPEAAEGKLQINETLLAATGSQRAIQEIATVLDNLIAERLAAQ